MAHEIRYSHPYFAFRNVSKSFGSTVVLYGISFEVQRGSTVCIMGHNGAAKSVCLLLMGFLRPDSGRIVAATKDITHYDEDELRQLHRKVTMVFPMGALSDSLTVAENVAVPLRERGGFGDIQIERRVYRLLDALGLAGIRNSYPADISMGMQQLAAIARALSENPEAMLLDEPATPMDPSFGHQLVKLVHHLKTELKMTTIVVTQDAQLARKIADRVLILNRGRLVFAGTIGEMTQASDPFVRLFLDAKELKMGGMSTCLSEL